MTFRTKNSIAIFGRTPKSAVSGGAIQASNQPGSNVDDHQTQMPITTTPGLLEGLRVYAATPNQKVRSAIYASVVGPALRAGNVHLGSILAANSLGSLSGDLITQRALDLLKLSFPALTAISSNFSDSPGRFGQTVSTRLRSIPGVSNYVPGTGYTTQNAVTNDVDVVIDQHKGVPITFNANELASTQRDLFGEQAEGAHHALGKAMVDALFGLITVANFGNETISALVDFNRSKATSMAGALTNRGVPDAGRFLLLNGEYFAKLQDDSSIVSYAAFQRPELITEYMLPRISGFQPHLAQTLPTAETLVGFGGTPDSLAIATRVPSDYTSVMPAANNGSVSVVTNPDTGISVQLVQYVDHVKAEATWRIAIMFGVAKGNVVAGQRLVSAATGS